MLLFWCSWLKYRFIKLDLGAVGKFCFHFSRVRDSVFFFVNPSARVALKPWLAWCAERVRANKSRHRPQGHSSHLHCASLLRIIYGVISSRLCTRILKTWRICLDIELCQLKNGSSSLTSMGTPIFFSSRCNQLIISFAWEKTDLISIAENWIDKKNSKYTVVFSILQSVNTSRNLVQIFNQGFSFLSESNLNVYLRSDTMYWL